MQQISSSKNMVLTFGYGNRKDYDVFAAYLEKFNVSYVIDVRLSPRAWSRKWYGDSIEKFCHSKKIGYTSKRALGNTSGCSTWIPPEKEDVGQTLSEVANMLDSGNILLLCAEMDYSRCHRVEVAQKIQDLTKALVKHLD
jgi:uncharacterized protein (DUF488 family)